MKTTFTFTLDAELLAQADKLARDSGTNLNDLVQQLIAERLNQTRTLPLLSREEFEALGGAFRLSSEDAARDYRDLAHEERMRKYERP